MKKIPLIVVGGPTASGKTALAIELAKALDGEIVSADSMQIYKYMDIGTAKPTADELKECPHHLIGFREPDCDFSVADYTELAHKTIADITARGKVAIMSGGTGLYINSVVNDVDFGEYENNYELRKSLDELAKKDGAGVLLDMLAEFDPVSAKRLHPNNVKRIIRAIEFYKVSGVPISEHQERTKLKESRYNATMFLINHNREVLYDRINRRVDIMISDGLVDEVRSIMNMGYSRDLNSMQGIGYKEMIAYLEGEISLADAIDMIKQNSRRYAKRQLTWFRRDDRINMLSPDDAVNEAWEILKKVELH
jgi:tRNA dimethylallyltransferase